jgi:hypothetical protein
MKLTTAALSLSKNANNLNQSTEATTLPTIIDTTTTTDGKTEENGTKQPSLRFIYSIKDNNNKFDIGTNHKNLLQEMMKMDTTVHIIPNDDSIPAYTDLAQFPNNETDFKRHFKVIEAKNHITVCHDITSNQPFNDMKFHKQNDQKSDTPLLQYMKKNNIVAKSDNFHRNRITSIGILICINPDIIHRDTLHKDLTEAVEDIDLLETDYNHFFCDMSAPLKDPPREEMEEDTLRFAPEFEVGYGTLSYKDETNGNISIKALDILCATTDAQLLKEIFSEIEFKEYYKTMLFIPRGLNKLNNDPLAYKKYVDCHINYMQNTTQFCNHWSKTKSP